MADGIVVDEEDVLLSERLFADVALERPVGVQIFLHRVVQFLALAVLHRLVVTSQVTLRSERHFAPVAFVAAHRVGVRLFRHGRAVEVLFQRRPLMVDRLAVISSAAGTALIVEEEAGIVAFLVHRLFAFFLPVFCHRQFPPGIFFLVFGARQFGGGGLFATQVLANGRFAGLAGQSAEEQRMRQ